MPPRPSSDRTVYPSTCGRGGEGPLAADGALGIDSMVALKPGALVGRSIVGRVMGPDAASGATVSSAAARVVFCGGSVTSAASTDGPCSSIVATFGAKLGAGLSPELGAGLPTPPINATVAPTPRAASPSVDSTVTSQEAGFDPSRGDIVPVEQ